MIRNPLAISLRGGRIDALHYGSVSVADPSGGILYSVNDPHFPTYLRSSIKMIQAIPVVLSGAADRFGFTDAELALCCASHTGASYHLETVQSILARIGLAESNLGCGAHEPENIDERNRLIRVGTPPSQLHNNCSGKHAGMLATCLAMGWPIESYLDIEHPLQQWVLELMAEYSGLGREKIGVGIDGCSLPAFYMPISGASTILARFMDRMSKGDVTTARIHNAVVAHPEMINEHGAFDTELIRAMKGRLIAKRGAMGMFVVGIITREYGPLGVSVKLEDGNMTPMPVVMMKVLEALDALSDTELAELERFRATRVTNWRGMDVGDISADFDVTPAAATNGTG